MISQSYDIMKEKWEVAEKDENGNLTGNTVTIDNLNPTTPPKKVIIKNNTENYEFVIPDKTVYPYFADTEFIFE
jgi:hypothetical protein